MKRKLHTDPTGATRTVITADELRELGRKFSKTFRGDERDLLSGIAAYHVLELRGRDQSLDEVYALVVDHVRSSIASASRGRKQ